MATQTFNAMNRKIHEGACLLLVPGGPELLRKHWFLLFSFTAFKKKKKTVGIGGFHLISESPGPFSISRAPC